MKLYHLAFLYILLASNSCKKKSDAAPDCVQCNDPGALNYNANATANECCQYATIHVKPDVKTKLDDKVFETSGLVFSAGQVWTHNDSGGKNELYAVDTTNGNIKQTVVLEGSTNVDWEEVTKSSTHLYVADIGNNQGSRKNLKIYRFPIAALQSTATTIAVQPETIEFSYADQQDFTSREKHNYDCEAFIYYQNNLYLFTKNWLDLRCNLYRLPAEPGTYVAQQIGSFDVQGLITGATLSPSEQDILLIGYNQQTLGSFVWKVSDFRTEQFFLGKKKLIKIGTIAEVGQTEGICYASAHTIFLSNEKIPVLPARLYKINASDLTK